MISQNLISMETTISNLRASVPDAEGTQGQSNAAKLSKNAVNRLGAQAEAYTPEHSDGIEETDRSNIAFGKIHAINSSRMSIAKSIRTVDQTMETIADHIDQMEAPLQTIVKNFPPFPRGSEERVKLLQSYTSFRKLIEQLSFPPEDKVAATIMGQSSDSMPAGDLNVAFLDDSFDRIVHSQQIQDGAEGLGLPELSADSSDEEVASALDELDTARQALAEKRAQLAADTLGLDRLTEQNAQRGELYESIVAQRGRFAEETATSGETLYSTLVEQRQAARDYREQEGLYGSVAGEKVSFFKETGSGERSEETVGESLTAGAEKSTGELYDLIVNRGQNAEELSYEQVSHEVKDALSDQTISGLSGDQGFFMKALL
jgi:hypothetical protein